MKIIPCATLKEYYIERAKLILKGYTEITSNTQLCNGENLILIDDEFCLFSLTKNPE